jgi:monofunctional biosynthetic peptidoglycan transglycosylase
MASTHTGNQMNKLWKIIALLLLLGTIDIGRYFIFPDIKALKNNNPLPTAFMEYRQEQWAAENRDKELTQKWVPMSKISPNVIKAVLIGEDDGFWKHDGFDIKGMENAIERSIKKKTLASGSTISQQLSKNLYLSPSKNPVRKIKEAILTWRIEKTLSKRRILEIYLNVAEWGDGIFGIEAAARHYYHKSAKKLTAREASRLVAVLPNPIKYNPIGNQKYVKNRARIIYKTMQRRGIISSVYQEIMTQKAPDTSLGSFFDDNATNLPLLDSSSKEEDQVNTQESNSDLPLESTPPSDDEGNESQ